MTDLEKLIKTVDVGQAIFEELFAMSDKEIAKKLISITDGNHNDVLTSKYDCTRIIKNEKPEKIEFWYYDGLRVDWSGVSLVSEHGIEQKIVKFNKHFKL